MLSGSRLQCSEESTVSQEGNEPSECSPSKRFHQDIHIISKKTQPNNSQQLTGNQLCMYARLKAKIDAYVEVVQNQTAADQPGLSFWKCNRDKYNTTELFNVH
ncbi:MAG: hypothetical protein GY820_04855 [Gammaproteobacteria bacterium]|nr:hypothetical protein [Gammaproteobacteria bacterium]